ncbi:hypothetical protein LOK49_LG02G01170 [Camellia lanceoleosa]|uniref:Uncharacterized protein n=1 Tax=Camellia lanceoleosa TaxID=1840588 RepID=A0ACC0IMH6_9ERIC|nr:hypothetical protein LOK49_LG02G01170 [Camellia lanceoleosa]
MAARKPGLIALFDVDGTLTAYPKVVTSDAEVHARTSEVINDYDYVVAENGLVAYKDGKLIGTQKVVVAFSHSLRSYLGEEKLKVRPFSCSLLNPGVGTVTH